MDRFAQGLSELVLIVADVQVSAEFYRTVVGLEPDGIPSPDWAWFRTGSRHDTQRIGLHRGSLLFEDQSPFAPGERWGRVHYAFEVPRSRLEDAVRHVRSAGVEVHGPTYFEWMRAKSYYFYDPDGNLLEWWSPDPA